MGEIIDRKRIHTMAWHKICRPKCEGGLGIRRIKHINVAF